MAHCSGLWTSALCLRLQGGHLKKGLHRDSCIYYGDFLKYAAQSISHCLLHEEIQRKFLRDLRDRKSMFSEMVMFLLYAQSQVSARISSALVPKKQRLGFGLGYELPYPLVSFSCLTLVFLLVSISFSHIIFFFAM